MEIRIAAVAVALTATQAFAQPRAYAATDYARAERFMAYAVSPR